MSRPSFQFYPADWPDYTYWVQFCPMCPVAVPMAPACYAIFIDDVLAYIGQTSNLRARMRAHKIDIHKFILQSDSPWGTGDVRVKAHFGKKFGDWAMRELRLIRKLQPSRNSVGLCNRRVAR